MNKGVLFNFLFAGLVLVGTLGAYSGSASAAGLTLYTDPSYCSPCRSLDTWLGSAAGKSAVGNIEGGLTRLGGETPDGGAIPGLFKDGQRIGTGVQEIQNALAKEGAKINNTICVVPRPGQDESFGPLTDKPFPVEGQVRDTEAVHSILEGHVADEAVLNFELRKLGSKTMAEQLASANANAPKEGKQITITPNESQAWDYVDSMGGNPNARGSYNINGTKVPVGQYKANDTNDRTGIVFDDKCENPKSVPKVKDPGTPGGQQFSSPNQPGSGGNPGSGGGGGLGGLSALLPLLMQGLLGGGQGNQGNLGGQGQSGTGNGNVAIPCSAYGTSPVCGADGQTYTNSCYMQQYGVAQVSAGVCQASGSSSSANLSSIITQLVASGVPQSIIDSVVSAFNTIPLNPSAQIIIP